MAVGQLQIGWLMHRYRGQAPSHIWIFTRFEGCALLQCTMNRHWARARYLKDRYR